MKNKGILSYLITIICLVSLSTTAYSQEISANSPHTQTCQVLSGIDVLQRDHFKQLNGQRVGVVTNHTGINREWISTVQLLNEAKEVHLVALFSPEHGFEGKLDVAKINDARDTGTGLKIYSLYGKTRIPTDEMLAGIDTLVFDIQDIGTRFYTYISTMGNIMRAAAKHDIRVVILDRPNPINGMDVQGPVLDAGSESFVGYHRIAVRHGMTTGELAKMFQAELKLNLDLKIIKIEGWDRSRFFDATGLPWINPSPNMRCLTQALLYPGIGLLETTNLSVGRGTDTPFEIIGAPYIDGVKLARKLNTAGLTGIRFIPIRFIPDSSKFKNEQCGGVNFVITNRKTFHPLKTGLELARTLRLMYPDEWKTDSLNRLLSHQNTYKALRAGKTIDVIEADYQKELKEFRVRRKRYLLY